MKSKKKKILKTFIDPKRTKFTRIFSKKEIKDWLKEDNLSVNNK